MKSGHYYRIFALLCMAAVLIWWNALVSTFSLALGNDAYTHILLIPPISMAMVLLDRKSHTWQPVPGIRAGCVVLALGLLARIAGLRWGRVDVFTGDVRLALEMLGLVMWWIGSFVCCFGVRLFRRCAFPLLFLLWLVPMPDFVVNHVVELLQQGTAACVRILFTAVGVPVAQDGVALTIPGLTVAVAEECSSIRSSMMLVVSSMVMSYLLLRSYWGRALVMLAALPLCVAKNGLRVFTLALLGAYIDRGYLTGSLHHQGGALFFAVSLAGVLLLISFFGWIEHRTSTKRSDKQLSLLSAAGNMS